MTHHKKGGQMEDIEKLETYLVMDKLLKQIVPRNREHKARKKHPQRDHHSACKRLPIPAMSINISTLEPDKRRKNDERRWQDVAQGDAIDEDALGEPTAFKYGFDLHEGDGSVSTTE